MMRSSRIQFGTLRMWDVSTQNPAVVLTHGSRIAIPKHAYGKPSSMLEDVLTYVTNVSLDEHGTWTFVGMDGPREILLQRQIQDVELGYLQGTSGQPFVIGSDYHGVDPAPLHTEFPNLDDAVREAFELGFYLDQSPNEGDLDYKGIRLWRPRAPRKSRLSP